MSTITALSGEPINNNGGATRNTFLTLGSTDNKNISNVPNGNADKAFKAISDTKEIKVSQRPIPEAGRIIRKVTATPASIFSGGSQSNLFRSVNSAPLELSSKNIQHCVIPSGTTVLPGFSGASTGKVFFLAGSTDNNSLINSASGLAITGVL